MANRGAVVARIISEYSDKGTKAATKDLQKFSKDSSYFGKQFAEVGKKLVKAFAVVEIAKFGFEAIKTAEAVNGAFSKMNVAFANTGSALNSNSPEVQGLVEHMTSLAFTSAETADALARGATVFHSAGAAMNNMSLAADVARASGLTLTDSMLMLGRAAEGKTSRALVALGVVMPKTGTAAQKYKIITDQLTKSLQGQAEAYAQTHPIEAMKAKFEELSNSVGQLLLPVFNAVVKVLDTYVIPTLVKALNFLRQNPQYLQPVVDAFALFVNVLAKVGVVALDLVGAFLKVDSVILQVVRGIGWLTNNKGMQDWAKKAADGLGNASKALVSASEKLDKFHLNATKLKATSPIVVKSLGSIAGATDATTAATSKLSALQIKVLDNLKQMGIIPRTETDPIELEAAKLNVIKENQGAQAAVNQSILDQLESQMSVNDAAQKYADILNVLADHKLDPSEIEMLATKWGMSKDQVVAYIAQITGDVTLATSLYSGGNLAADAWTKALDALNAYLKALGANTGAVGAGAGTSSMPQEQIPSTTPPKVPTLLPSGDIQLTDGSIIRGSNGADVAGGNPSSVSSFGSGAATLYNTNPTTGADRAGGLGTIIVNMAIDGTQVAQAVVPAVTTGILNNQVSGKSILYSGAAI